MAKIGIVSDSNCDLPEETISKLDIGIVPGKIIFGDEEVRRHYVDLTYEEFYHRLVKDKTPISTSVPSPKEYYQVYEEALKKYDEIIVFCTSSKLSNMHNVASMVAKQFPPDKITVIDSQKITLPMGIIVSEIATKASQGASKKELINCFENKLLPRTQALLGIPTLTYLQKGGRIGKIASVMGNLMHFKPIIFIDEGELNVITKVRGMDNVYKLFLGIIQEVTQKQKLNLLVVGHTANPNQAIKLAQEVETFSNPPEEIRLIEIGPSVGTHLGPGGLAISWLGEFDNNTIKQ